MIPYGQGHSFFISLFRYICIIHAERLSKRKISPEVRKNIRKQKQFYFLFYQVCLDPRNLLLDVFKLQIRPGMGEEI